MVRSATSAPLPPSRDDDELELDDLVIFRQEEGRLGRDDDDGDGNDEGDAGVDDQAEAEEEERGLLTGERRKVELGDQVVLVEALGAKRKEWLQVRGCFPYRYTVADVAKCRRSATFVTLHFMLPRLAHRLRRSGSPLPSLLADRSVLSLGYSVARPILARIR